MTTKGATDVPPSLAQSNVQAPQTRPLRPDWSLVKLSYSTQVPPPHLTADGEPGCDWWKCERGVGGSLLLGAPEPRGDGAEGESRFLLLGELGQTLLLLLTHTQPIRSQSISQTETGVRLISPPTCAS